VRSDWRDGERVRTVEVTPLGGGRWRVLVDETPLELGVEKLEGGRLRLLAPEGGTLAEITAAGARRFVRLGSLDFVLDREAAATRQGRRPADAGGLEAPMPGVVTRVLVAAGDAVEKGQPLVALEAMKMEHLIRAPRAGRIARVSAKAGEMVNGGVPLVELEDASPAGER
jgi:acetyl/propionyl-CoA carboxylase alpha subunit